MPKFQAQLILEALQAGEAITPLDALNRFSCFRLGARIYDLRKKGYDIRNIGTDDGNYAKYVLKYAAPIPKLPPAFPPKPVDTNNSLF
jgi:Helix-turn-helix domain